MSEELSDDRKKTGLHFVVRSSDGVAHKIPVIADDQKNESEISSPAYDSASWTGLPKSFVLTDERRSAIVRELDAVEQILPTSDVTQHDQAQARAYIVAAKTLLEAPEPESELAWQLIGKANNLAGIASLLVSLIALFLK